MNETPMDTTPMSATRMITKHLKTLAGGREADRRAEAAAAALAAAAADEGLLDVAIGLTGSPIGELLLAMTPRGLAYVAFEDEERDELLERLARDLSPRILEHQAASDAVRRQLDDQRHCRTRRRGARRLPAARAAGDARGPGGRSANRMRSGAGRVSARTAARERDRSEDR